MHRDKLLAEFKDHGVVKISQVAPEESDEETMGGWVWIPLRVEEVEELVENEEWKEDDNREDEED